MCDIYPDGVQLKKGDYTLRALLRHDDAALLQKLKVRGAGCPRLQGLRGVGCGLRGVAVLLWHKLEMRRRAAAALPCLARR